MSQDRKAPTVNQRIRQLKRQRKTTGGKSVALPPGVRKTKRKTSKSKRGTFHK